jgi:hypothetical protein
MSFVYRPTPVIVLSGKTVGGDHVPLRGLPAGTMHGYTPNMTSPALNAIGRRTLKGDPWLISSGTMGSFLAQDSSGLDLSTTMAPDVNTLTPPDFAPIVFTDMSTMPLAPTMAPDINTLIPPPTAAPTGSLLSPSQITAASQQASAALASQQALSAAPSLLTSIANIFKPTPTVTPMTAAQPGVYNPYATTPSWFQQSNILPGAPNWTILAVGLLAAAMFASAIGGSRK